jgi:3-isopropylmalate/(R)-2-methylmalate dehydratase small subunit
MALTIEGRVWKFGDNILNDGQVVSYEMIKAGVIDPKVLAESCMTSIDRDFPKKARAGDLIVAGKNFGKGQNHITGPLAIKGLGLAVIAESISRPFFRQSVVAGLLMLPFVNQITSRVAQGDTLNVDFRTGRITNVTSGNVVEAAPLPSIIADFLEAGGERAWLEQNFGTRRSA